uniref:Speedy protein E4-like n=1 Tax=Sciurus vulgaris TaxID=55149 RepID=A0A8D2DWG6_SCIVU
MRSKDSKGLEGMKKGHSTLGESWVTDSVPRAEFGLMTETTGKKRKRESSSESVEELQELDSEPNHAWDVDSLYGLKMKFKRLRINLVQPEHHEVFKKLLEDPVVKRFLAWDKNLRVSDKYLLSMVIAYFSRAGFFSWQYQRIHFFLEGGWLQVGCGEKKALEAAWREGLP